MSSILTNNSAMAALSTLRNINNNLGETQGRISSGMKVASGKDNAAYFAISSSMKGDSGMLKAIDESLTMTKNATSTGRLGAETVQGLAQQFVERVAFAQSGTPADLAKVQEELTALTARMDTSIKQSTFNGVSMVDAAATSTVVSGITRGTDPVTGAATFNTTTISLTSVDLTAVHTALSGIDLVASGAAGTLATDLATAEGQLKAATDAATTLGIGEKTIDTQKQFLGELSKRMDAGVGGMVDANMEEEAARLQSLQVQQQLATQSLSIANQAPQSILSLFR